MRATRSLGAALACAFALGASAPAAAVDADDEFVKGTTIVGVAATGGVQNNLQHERRTSGIAFVGGAARLSYLPFDPLGDAWYQLALEPGLEAWGHYYLHPAEAGAGGLKLALRLHAVGLGPVVPYIEGTAGAGGTGLDLPESRSTFTFVIEAGAGVSLLVARGVAVSVGYRLQHLSNGNTSGPNRGYNAHTGIAGLSLFFR